MEWQTSWGHKNQVTAWDCNNSEQLVWVFAAKGFEISHVTAINRLKSNLLQGRRNSILIWCLGGSFVSTPVGTCNEIYLQLKFWKKLIETFYCTWLYGTVLFLSNFLRTVSGIAHLSLPECPPFFFNFRRPCFNNNNKPTWFSPKKCYTLHQRRLRTALYLSLVLNPIQFRASISTVTITIVFSDFIYGKKTLSETFALYDFLFEFEVCVDDCYHQSSLIHGLRTLRERLLSKIVKFWAVADKLQLGI